MRLLSTWSIKMMEMDKVMIGIGATIVALLLVCIFAIVQESKDCEAKGGEMVGTGRYTTTYVMSGSVLMPISSEVTECSK